MPTKARVTLGYLINYCNFTKYLYGEFQTILRDSANCIIIYYLLSALTSE